MINAVFVYSPRCSPGDVPDLTCKPSLAEQEMGFKAPRSLEEMCRDLWTWQSSNPEGYASQS